MLLFSRITKSIYTCLIGTENKSTNMFKRLSQGLVVRLRPINKSLTVRHFTHGRFKYQVPTTNDQPGSQINTRPSTAVDFPKPQTDKREKLVGHWVIRGAWSLVVSVLWVIVFYFLWKLFCGLLHGLRWIDHPITHNWANFITLKIDDWINFLKSHTTKSTCEQVKTIVKFDMYNGISEDSAKDAVFQIYPEVPYRVVNLTDDTVPFQSFKEENLKRIKPLVDKLVDKRIRSAQLEYANVIEGSAPLSAFAYLGFKYESKYKKLFNLTLVSQARVSGASVNIQHFRLNQDLPKTGHDSLLVCTESNNDIEKKAGSTVLLYVNTLSPDPLSQHEVNQIERDCAETLDQTVQATLAKQQTVMTQDTFTLIEKELNAVVDSIQGKGYAKVLLAFRSPSSVAFATGGMFQSRKVNSLIILERLKDKYYVAVNANE